MRRALAWLGLLLGALAARAEPPACRAQLLLEPPRAVVGEQVRVRVRVQRRDDVLRVDWARPLAFPSARAEELPPEPQRDAQIDGVAYHVHDEVRALFPERAGSLALAGAALRCELAAGTAQQVDVPGAVLQVDALPLRGRPPDFSGLVGPLLLHVAVTPERVELGAAVRIALLARGAGNLWVLEHPFPAGSFGSAEVFEIPPELALERGSGLFLRQHLALDVVPRRVGRLRVPALSIPYFDPASGTYRVATSEEVQVLVVERAEGSTTAGASPARGTPTASAESTAPRGSRAPFARGWLAPLGLALALGVGVGGWRWRRRAADPTAQALREAAAARAAGDFDTEQRQYGLALRRALARVAPEAAALAPDELGALPQLSSSVRAAVALLQALERARFERSAARVGAEEVARVLSALGASRAASRSSRLSMLAYTGLLAASALLSACASGGISRDEPMTPARLEAWLREQTESLEVVDGQLRFVHAGVRMIVLHDLRADRVRLVAVVTPESALTVVTGRILLQANFGNTLDARYAIRDGTLYAVYLHPLSTLAPRDLESALDQVANLVRTFGTTYTALGVGG